jgi:purine-nucleoside phosphorylase
MLGTNFYNEESVLDVSRLIEWKRKRNSYNFKTLPKTAIITLNDFFIDRKTRFLSKKIKGIIGSHYQINKNLLVATGFGNGASAVISLLEELRGLGVENFLFIGFAASLDASFNENKIYILKKGFSSTGCTVLYSPNDSFRPKEHNSFSNLESKLKLDSAICWSTDAPFRETQSLIDSFKEKGATHVDMESSAVYAFSEFYNLNSLCTLITADNFANSIWSPPKDLNVLNKTISSFVKKCINILSYES